MLRELARTVSCLVGLATITAVLPSLAKAQCFDCGTEPPTVFIGVNSPQPSGTASVSITLEYCDDYDINNNTHVVTLNGVNVTSNFPLTNGSRGGCGQFKYSNGSVTLSPGNNTLVARISDFAMNEGENSTGLVYSTVRVTMKTAFVTAPQHGTSVPQDFIVKNIGTSTATFNLTRTCSAAVSPCSGPSSVSNLAAGDSATVTVTYPIGATGTTGTIKLLAAASTNSALKDSATVNVTAASSLVGSGTFNNNDLQATGLCAANCFAAVHAQGTVPYVSLDQPRNVTLVYHGDRVAVRPFVYAEVSHLAGSPSVTEYWFQVKDSVGNWIPFVNGDATKIRYQGGTPPSAPIRLGGQIDASAWSGTKMYPIQIVITAVRGSYNETYTYDTKLLVVDERKSLVGRGWTIAGLQRLFPQGSSAMLITEGDGSATFMTCGAGVCVGPTGDHSKITISGSGGSTLYTRLYRDSTKIWFRSTGLMDSTADRFGNTVRFEYDGSGRLTRIYDPIRTYNAGASRSYIALSYGSYGLTQIQEPGTDGSPTGGRITSVTVNADSTLRVIKDPDGDSTRFAYDGSKRLQTITDRRGSATTLVYDATSWKLSRTDLPEVAIDAGGGTTQNATPSISFVPWQSVGIPTASTAGTAAAWARADTAYGKIIGAVADTSKFTVDRWGQPLVSVDALGNTTTITRVNLLPSSVTSPTGQVDKFGIDSDRIVWSKPAGKDTTHYEYDSYLQVSRAYGGQAEQRFYRSGTGKLDSIKVAGVFVTKFRYDARGRDSIIVDNGGDTTRFHYDAKFGNRDSTQAPGARFVAVKFDGYGRDSVARANGTPRRVRLYDVLNRVTRDSLNPDPKPTTYTYDKLFLIEIRDPKGQRFKWDVNALGWKTKEYDPADTVNWNRFISYRYDKAGRLTSYTNRRSQRVDLSYDKLGRLLSKGGPSNIVADSFTYNATGTRLTGWNAVARDSIFIAGNGWTDSVVTQMAGKRFRRYYKATSKGQIDSIKFHTSSGITFADRDYAWNDVTGLLDSVRVGAVRIPNFNRDAEGFDSLSNWHSSFHRTTLYTRNDQPYSVAYSVTAVDTALRRSYVYGDSLMRMTQIARTVGSDTKLRDYAYDDLGRLRRLQYGTIVSYSCPAPGAGPVDDGSDCSSGETVQVDTIFGFEYDAAGNLTKVRDSTNSVSVLGTYGAGNRITGWGSATYATDVDGNVTSKTEGGATTTYTWTADGRLASVIKGSDTLYYDYGPGGELVRKRRNASTVRHFLWDSGHLWAELDGSATNRIGEYAYLPGLDQPLALVTGGQSIAATRSFQTDGTGSVIAVLSNTALAQRLEYGPLGSSLSVSGAVADTNRLRWKGMVWEGDSTRLYFARARWYDPSTGRFLSEDPLGSTISLNAYSFGGADPVNSSDPLGLDRCRTFDVAINGDSTNIDKVTVCRSSAGMLFLRTASFGSFWINLRTGRYSRNPEAWTESSGLSLASAQPRPWALPMPANDRFKGCPDEVDAQLKLTPREASLQGVSRLVVGRISPFLYHPDGTLPFSLMPKIGHWYVGTAYVGSGTSQPFGVTGFVFCRSGRGAFWGTNPYPVQ